MPVGVRDEWLHVDGLRIHLLVAGVSGPAVVLLHGGGRGSAQLAYGHVFASFAQHCRVYALDWPGYGESEKPPHLCSTDWYIAFLGKLLDALGLQSAGLVGVSFGGGVALGFALQYPERVTRLTLVNSLGLGGEIPGGVASSVVVRIPFLNRASWWVSSRSARVTRWSLKGIFHDRRMITPALVREMMAVARRPHTSRVWLSWQRHELGWHGLRTNYLDRLHDLRVPTMIVHGADDHVIPVAWARRAHARIATSWLVVLANCGHWPMREDPDAFSHAVAPFFAFPERIMPVLAAADLPSV